MRIEDSARRQLEALLASSEPGAVASLLLGYTYDESWNKTPHVDIAVMPQREAEEMQRELAAFDEQLIHELDGFTFALPMSDDDGLLEGRLLTFTADGFSLVRASS